MKEHHTIDKEIKRSWGEGEWVDEPDQVEFTYQGFECKIIRVCIEDGSEYFGGYLNGYIKIPDDLEISDETIESLKVHGGITFNERNVENLEYCSDGHWIGFDCSHYLDMAPSAVDVKKKVGEKLIEEFKHYDNIIILINKLQHNINYKNIGFVKREIIRVINQIKWEKEETNNFRISHINNETKYYCGNCGIECDDEAEVLTKTHEDNRVTILKITCENCLLELIK